MKQTKWFERKFPRVEDPGLLPNLLVRLESSPVFVKQKLWPLDENLSEKRIDDKWSIKEELGHLIDLEELWSGRLDDLNEALSEMRPADLSNRKTHEGNHNETLLSDLIEGFSIQRKLVINKIRQMGPEQRKHAALHPRLKTPMNVVGLAYFIAEHDDHHIASILNKMRALQS